MLDPLALLGDVALAFEASTNPRTLLPRLANALHRHVPVVEVELIRRPSSKDTVVIVAFSPESGRRWRGERSSRVLERVREEQQLGEFTRVSEPSRVSDEEIDARLRLAVCRGILGIGLARGALDRLRDARVVELLVTDLRARLEPLGWLDRLAERSRHSFARTAREITETPVNQASSKSTEISVTRKQVSITDITVSHVEDQITDMPVPSFAEAQRRAIAHALSVSRGKIYGEDGAAALLGLKPSTLQSKMRKLGMERLDFRG